MTNFSQVHKSTLYNAISHKESWAQLGSKLIRKTHLMRCRKPRAIPEFIKDWILRNTSPSSNTKNTIITNVGGSRVRHVIHWRTDSIECLYSCCKIDVENEFGILFKKTYFYSLIPRFVKIKKMQDGLCPAHHTGITLQRCLKEKRLKWHKGCSCRCPFCTECDHGRCVYSVLCLPIEYFQLPPSLRILDWGLSRKFSTGIAVEKIRSHINTTTTIQIKVNATSLPTFVVLTLSAPKNGTILVPSGIYPSS